MSISDDPLGMKAIFDTFDKATETWRTRAKKARIRDILEDCANVLTDAGAHPSLVYRINTILENYPE